jgi:hypothetical protein
MVSRDLTKVLNDCYPADTETRDYLEQLATLSAVPAVSAQCDPTTDLRHMSAR